MRYVENEGALFRIKGPSNAYPDEIWNPRIKQFEPYQGDVPKPVSWGGQDLTEDEVMSYLRDCCEGEPGEPATS
jgi:hypothetical protein